MKRRKTDPAARSLSRPSSAVWHEEGALSLDTGSSGVDTARGR